MTVTHLDSRRNKILEFIIQTYVETACPVGSRAVVKRCHLRLSPATVRNVMGDLEEHSLLSHPHTSAGRVPTDRGYRYYVDLLMVPQVLSEQEIRAMDALAKNPADEPLDLLREAARLLARLTGQAGAVLAPCMMQSALRRVDLIPVNEHRALCVLVTTDGMLKTVYLEFEELVDTAELSRVARFLNQELSGQVLGAVSGRLEQALVDTTNAFSHLYRRAQELWKFNEFEDLLLVEGFSRLMSHPEFRDPEGAWRLLEALEVRQPLVEFFSEVSRQGRRTVAIGSQNSVPGFERCSIVAAPYRVGDRPTGAIGVIGPVRMEYSKVIPVIDRMAEAIGRAMERFAA
ncbi:MAG: heat-inducible transcription repressor HrcA [Candidatus Omnitrophica bacterium]|nr:heat-inducible transcription repressor HrcA [Candidatus Omnitrophota bacterium]